MQAQDRFIYYFSNVSAEDAYDVGDSPSNTTTASDLRNTSVSTDPSHSTASSFMAICDLELAPILELRSTNAQIALSEFAVDNLPLCFIHTESVCVTVNTPPPLLTSNRIINSKETKKTDEVTYRIQFTDFTSDSIQSPIIYLNNMLGQRINSFLIYRLSLPFFDLDLFKSTLFQDDTNEAAYPLSGGDIKLLLKYTSCTLHKRAQIHNILTKVTLQTPLPITIRHSNPALSARFEESQLNVSSSLLPLLERHNPRTISVSQFSDYYDVSLSSANVKKAALETKIDLTFLEYLKSVWIDLNDLSADDSAFVTQISDSNLALYRQGETLKTILLVEEQRINNDLPDSLFTNQFLSFELDQSGSKCQFRMNNKKFLPPNATELTVRIDPYASYRLGGNVHLSHTQIGPITHASDCNAQPVTKLTHNITSSRQRLPSSIRQQPRLIRFFTDLIATSDIVYQWTREQDSDSAFRVLYTLQLCDSMIQSRFLFKESDTLSFHRLLRSANSFRQLSVLMLDENQRRVYFPFKTYCHGSIVIQSTATN